MKDIPFEKVSPVNATPKSASETGMAKPSGREWMPQREVQEPTQPNVKELFPWVKQLPPEVRPKELIVQYARIAHKLAELWKHPLACEKYLNSLMIDERGTRQGFPPEVAQELAALHVYFSTHVQVPHYGVWGERIGE